MTSGAKREVFTLSAGFVAGREKSSRHRFSTAFTLVEILVAAAITATVVSAVYGTYFAASRSAAACGSRMATFEKTQKALEQMARHVRCAYGGPEKRQNPTPDIKTDMGKIPSVDTINYFNGGSSGPKNEILHLVTTNGNIRSQPAADGLYEVTYKFDKSTGCLLVSRKQCSVPVENEVGDDNWSKVAENVESIALRFFDGQQWFSEWDFGCKKKLPAAVKIEIVCSDEHHRRFQCSTTAQVYCSQDIEKERIKHENR